MSQGSIYRLGRNRWRIRIYRGSSRGNHDSFFYGNKEHAKSELRRLIQHYAEGGEKLPKRISLGDHLHEWLEAMAGQVTHQTLDGYREDPDKYTPESLSLMPLHKLEFHDFQRVYDQMVDNGESTATVRRLHTHFKQALEVAVQSKIIPFSPVAEIEPPPERSQKIKAMSQPQVQAFLRAAKPNAHSLVFKVALHTGLRPSEYMALTWDCVEWDASGLRVEKCVTRPQRGAPSFAPLDNAQSCRTVSLPSHILEELRGHQAKQELERLSLGKRWTDNNLVFPNCVGEFLDETTFSEQVFQPLLGAAGLSSEFRLYDLRHTCAILLLSAGESNENVSKRLGHSGSQVTADRYSRYLRSVGGID